MNVHKTVTSCRIHPFCSDAILMRCVSISFQPWSRAFVTTKAFFVFRFPISRWVSPLLFIGVLRSIAAGIGTSNFLRATFIVSLNSLSFGSMKNIPLNSLALSSFGFSIAHLCFAFFFAASEICTHISGHTLSGREVVCFLVSPPLDHAYPSGGLSFKKKMNLVKPVQVSDHSFSPSTFQ